MMLDTVSSRRCMKLGIINTVTLLIVLLFFWTKSHGQQFNSTRHFSSENAPENQYAMLKVSNKTHKFMNSLKAKYSNVHISEKVNTKLNDVEKEKLRVCVTNGERDRKLRGSKFWEVQQIRRTHHTYLARKDAVLIEVGGNTGSDASEFVRLYNPNYIILEPLEEYANVLTEKFKDNPRVTVVNVGLGKKNEVVMVKIEGKHADATSKFSYSRGGIPLYITNATDFLLEIGLGLFDIDLLTMNCEGCEFEALETILSTNLINHLRNIQFATHTSIKGLINPTERYCKMQQLLWRTHRPTYQFKFVWESWRRRDLS